MYDEQLGSVKVGLGQLGLLEVAHAFANEKFPGWDIVAIEVRSELESASATITLCDEKFGPHDPTSHRKIELTNIGSGTECDWIVRWRTEEGEEEAYELYRTTLSLYELQVKQLTV